VDYFRALSFRKTNSRIVAMKIFCSRRLRLIKYLIFVPPFYILLSLYSTNRRLFHENVSNGISNQTPEFHNELKNAQNRIKVDKTQEPITEESTTTAYNLTKPENYKKLLQFITDNNENPVIKNKHFIENLLTNKAKTLNIPKQSNTTTKKLFIQPKFLVILIQIHSRFNYLKALIQSLKNTKHIEDSLVIFSHDVYDEEMNNLINNITFCATLQIFYPFSLQVYQNRFPGGDPNDCKKTYTKAQAIKANCNNAYHADSYGHFREHKIVQIKHHWFWKLSFVFEKLKFTKNLDDLQILLLEEDYFLMPDSIHVLRKLSEKILSDIDVVSLAYIEKLVQNLEFKKTKKYSKGIWHSSHHNTGLMLGRTQWNMLKNCLNAFCTYDDYNWDWTLQYISQNCFKLPMVSIYPSSSRVIHIGECGTHYKGKNCDPKKRVNELNTIYKDLEKNFFPQELVFDKVDTGIRPIKKSNGGWSDPRDHQLCKSHVQQDAPDLTKITIAKKIFVVEEPTTRVNTMRTLRRT